MAHDLISTPRRPLFAVETDKPSKTHRCSGRSSLTTQGPFPDTGPSAGCCLPIEKQQSIGYGMKWRSVAEPVT